MKLPKHIKLFIDTHILNKDSEFWTDDWTYKCMMHNETFIVSWEGRQICDRDNKPYPINCIGCINNKKKP